MDSIEILKNTALSNGYNWQDPDTYFVVTKEAMETLLHDIAVKSYNMGHFGKEDDFNRFLNDK